MSKSGRIFASFIVLCIACGGIWFLLNKTEFGLLVGLGGWQPLYTSPIMCLKTAPLLTGAFYFCCLLIVCSFINFLITPFSKKYY